MYDFWQKDYEHREIKQLAQGLYRKRTGNIIQEPSGPVPFLRDL